MLYMVTFTINIPQMLAYIPYMDPMGNEWRSLCLYSMCINDTFFRCIYSMCKKKMFPKIGYCAPIAGWFFIMENP